MISRRIRDIMIGVMLFELFGIAIKLMAAPSFSSRIGMIVIASMVWGLAYLCRARNGTEPKSWWDS